MSNNASRKKKNDERRKAFDSLPPHVKETLTEEEKDLFLNADQWPESLFDKLDEFIVHDSAE